MTPIDWNELTLELEGIPLVSPCLKISFELDYLFDPAPVAEFYASAWRILGDHLVFHYGQGGRFTKLKPETMVRRTAQLAELKPSKYFTHTLLGTKFGQSAAGMDFFIHYDPRVNFDRPGMLDEVDEIERTGGVRFVPPGSWAQISLPIDHPLVTGGKVLQWLSERPLLQSIGLISGTVGYAVISCRGETVSNPYMRELRAPLLDRLETLGRKYPFLEQEYTSGVSMLFDPKTMRAHRRPLPLLKHLSWRTLISSLTLDRDGLGQRVGAAVAECAGQASVEPAPQGIWLQLGDDPSRQLSRDEGDPIVTCCRVANRLFADVLRTRN